MSSSSAFRPFSTQQQQERMTQKELDNYWLQQAIECANRGRGHTFPNPPVGCCIVDHSSNSITKEESKQGEKGILVGKGFHPRSGFPHAEIFALFQAMGHVECGVEAAQSIVDMELNIGMEQGNDLEHENQLSSLQEKVLELTKIYKTGKEGVDALFGASASNSNNDDNGPNWTAYVTLEPCCHEGKRTPPCAQTFVTTGKFSRIVVGYRDPHPQVDGGGIQTLLDANMNVDVYSLKSKAPLGRQCASLISNFEKRLSVAASEQQPMTSAQRSNLRKLAGRRKTDKTLSEISGSLIVDIPLLYHDSDDDDDDDDRKINWSASIDSAREQGIHIFKPSWLETLDSQLWNHEMVLIRFQNVSKKQFSKALGEHIAKLLSAHFIQAIGHTVLLYRPKYKK